jgi:hypothetical protein
MPPKDPFFDYYLHQRSLPDYALRDLARNGAADRSYRKNAVEILFNRKSPFAQHEDLRELLDEIKAELEGIQFEFPAPSEEVKPVASGTPSASITTATMFGDGDVIDNTVAEFHAPSVPAILPENSGSVLRVVEQAKNVD